MFGQTHSNCVVDRHGKQERIVTEKIIILSLSAKVNISHVYEEKN